MTRRGVRDVNVSNAFKLDALDMLIRAILRRVLTFLTRQLVDESNVSMLG